MGRIISSYILPHPPVMIPEIGRNRTKDIEKTIQSANAIADEIAAYGPDTIIVSSPHAPCYRDMFHLSGQKILNGDFSDFGHSEIAFSLENNLKLSEAIVSQAEKEGLPARLFDTHESTGRHEARKQLDHGAMVPLYFIISRLPGVKVILISTPFMKLTELFRFGQCIGRAVEASAERVVYLASGDLSHGLTDNAPAGFCPSGREYDRSLIDMIVNHDMERLLAISEDEMEQAAECGTRSFVMMFGALSKYELQSIVYSYEGPFGVGYLAARIGVVESAQVRLARAAIDEWVRNKYKIPVPTWLPGELLKSKAGCFVSLKKLGCLRGCIGTIAATQFSLAEEIMQNARHAAVEDPRFSPVSADEIPELEITVDVLGQAENISSPDELDVRRYGVIVSSGWRRGLLLPDLDGIDNPQDQISIALRKAGISAREPYGLERFEVIRYY